MLSFVYSSVAATPFSEDDLAALLRQCRANNERLGLTGVLMYRDGFFLQLLEGEPDTVRERVAIIEADPRHDRVTALLEEIIQERQFPDWSMGYQAVTDERIGDVPGYRSTFDDISADGSGESLSALRELIGWYRAQTGNP